MDMASCSMKCIMYIWVKEGGQKKCRMSHGVQILKMPTLARFCKNDSKLGELSCEPKVSLSLYLFIIYGSRFWLNLVNRSINRWKENLRFGLLGEELEVTKIRVFLKRKIFTTDFAEYFEECRVLQIFIPIRLPEKSGGGRIPSPEKCFYWLSTKSL